MLGGLVTLLGFVTQFTSVFNDFAQQYTQIVQFYTDVETAKMIETAFKQEHRPLNETHLPQNWKNLVIRDLNFNHPKPGASGSEVNAQGVLSPMPMWKKSYGLKEMNLSIHRGQKIALIGESGCGKSTLLTLLRGLYAPSSNSILEVDGCLDLGFGHISNAVTLFPQEPEILEATFEYNITLGLPFEKEEVKRVCEVTRLDVVLNNLQAGVGSISRKKV